MKKLNSSHFLSALIGASIVVISQGGTKTIDRIQGLSRPETETLIQDLSAEEGWRRCQYVDQLGNATIGYGSLLPLSHEEQSALSLPPSPECMTERQATILLTSRADKAAVAFEGHYDTFNSLGTHIRISLIDAAFQLGPSGLLGFRNALSALSRNQCQSAIHGFEASKWDHQTPRRVDKLIHSIQEDCTS